METYHARGHLFPIAKVVDHAYVVRRAVKGRTYIVRHSAIDRDIAAQGQIGLAGFYILDGTHSVDGHRRAGDQGTARLD